MDDDMNGGVRPASAGAALALGAGLGALALAVFLVAYMIGWDLPIGWVIAIALGIAGLLGLAILYLPFGASPQVGKPHPDAVAPSALAEPAQAVEAVPIGRAVMNPVSAFVPQAVPIEQLEARAAQLRTELGGRKRAPAPLDWADAHAMLGDMLYELGRRELGTPGRRTQRTGLGHLRQGANAYRRVLEVRTEANYPRDWAVTQIALAQSLLMLAAHEAGTQQMGEAASVFAAALGSAELTEEERAIAQDGLDRAEGMLMERAYQADEGARDTDFF